MEEKDKTFENWWMANKQRVLSEDREYSDAIGTYKMTSGADWLLFGIPVVTGILCIEYVPIESEVLRWAVSFLAALLVSVACVYVKSLSNPHRPISDIEADVKKRCLDEYRRTGVLGKNNKTPTNR